jgi:hypothetical protein
MKKPKRQSKPLQEETEEERNAAHLAYRRKINTIFLFWTVCPEGPCKRAKRCAGDGEACFQRWWPHVPEECKIELRAFIDGLRRGLTTAEAADAIEAKVAEWQAISAVSARGEEDRNAQARAPVNGSAGGPRVRTL